jgi:hypothetical protein
LYYPIASMKAFYQQHATVSSSAIAMCCFQKTKSRTNCWPRRGYLDLGLAQILEMEDEDTGAEPNIVSASIADPFILLIRDDASIFLAMIDDSYDLEEVERVDDALLSTKWLTGCLYADNTGAFATIQSDKGQKDGENIMMFLLSAGGALHVNPVSSIF